MPFAILEFAAVAAGMVASLLVGWHVGRLMSPRPDDLREAARQLARTT